MIFNKDFLQILSDDRSAPKRAALLLFSVLIFTLILSSCHTSKQLAVVDKVQHDTCYIEHLQHDSIYLHDSTITQYRIGTIDTTVISTLGINLRVDTIYQDRLKYSYKYKLKLDTTYIHQVDSIPVIKEVTVTKEVKYTPWYIKTLAWIGAIMLVLIILYLILKFTKR